MKVGIAGATAYTSLELIKLLLRHPKVEIAYLGTRREGNPKVSQIFPCLTKVIDIPCAGLEPRDIPRGVELIFATLPPVVSMQHVSQYLKAGLRVIDFSADYRFKDKAIYEKWYKAPHTDPEGLKKAVYGLPELFRKEIKGAHLVSNPGCYPVSVILPLAPLLTGGLIHPTDIIVDSKSGVSGRGRELIEGSQYVECNENIEAYGVGGHRHLPEMETVLCQALRSSGKSGGEVKLYFTPHLAPMNRGILSTIYARVNLRQKMGGPAFGTASGASSETLRDTLKEFYKKEPFLRIKEAGEVPRTKEVSGTNFCDIAVHVIEERAIIISAIDNLIKGASGTAVQDMNIMYGFEEGLGLL